jgi:hypothetical protein
MAYEDDQQEYPLPTGDSNTGKSANFLPRYFRTDPNKKFLGSTIDQVTTPGVVEKINAFAGRREAKAVKSTDTYLPDVSANRENYQLEPAVVIKDNIGNVEFYKDYNDYIGQLSTLRSTTKDHSLLNRQEFYAWDPHVDWDKFTNFREYYWLPNGPQEVPVRGQSLQVQSTYTITTVTDDDNVAYLFTPNGLSRNPTLKLYRGQTYRFEIDCPGHPISIAISRAFQPAVDVVDSSLITTLYEDGVEITDDDTGVLKDRAYAIDEGFVEKGVLEFTVPMNAPETLYYISQTDINTSGVFNIFDIEENSQIDVETEILGKKTYRTSEGWDFSNGMKVYFQGNVTPESYEQGLYYVEGVGTGIKLVPLSDLSVPAIFTQDTLIPFDTNGFDRVPFSDAKSFAGTKDYICVNRGDDSKNGWSRYNRWFHKDVIELSASLNKQDSDLDESFRAKRPIIEFEPNLRLYNHGAKAKLSVDLVDTFTKDVFSTIEGQTGYNIDGIDIVEGMRILFTADPDSLVNGKIYEVKFILHTNTTQISLVETSDTNPVTDETVLVKDGTKNAGKMFWYNGTEWLAAQDKTAINQAPKFDLYDSNGYSIGDETYYPANDFSGNRIFSYRVGSGTNDPELGFPLSYKNINNVGDIVFDFNLLTQKYEYELNNAVIYINSDELFLKKTKNDSEYYCNAWTKANELSSQYVIRKYTGDDMVNRFPIDVYKNSANLTDLACKVFVNNKFLVQGVDWNFVDDLDIRKVNLVNELESEDVIIIKTKSSAEKTNQGHYEIPYNLERNPLNNNLTEFTLGQVNDHVDGMIVEIPGFNGMQPGPSNLRDLGEVSKYGRKFLQHSGPINLSLYHLIDKQANVVKAIRLAKTEYSKFKRDLISAAGASSFVGSAKEHLDLLLVDLTNSKTKSMPFYSTDMLAFGGNKLLEYNVVDDRINFYALSQVFNINTVSKKSVLVYLNDIQLTYGIDYTFTDNGFVDISATKQVDDVIKIYEYENTEGCFVPQTPTKLGLYPAYAPTMEVDNSYSNATNVIRGHDGSITVAYNDYRDEILLEFEKRIYNNLKVSYDENVFCVHDFIEGNYRKSNIDKKSMDKILISDFIKWLPLVGNPDYTSNDFIAQGDGFTYNYSRSISPTGEKLPGGWRAVYKMAYDTDRPHMTPWEMLGISVKPSWWETQYGPAPYTSDNLVMWKDIEKGYVKEPGKPIVVKNKFVRPNLTKHLPVNPYGQLVDPLQSGYAKEFSYATMRNDFFKFGDEAPIETAWRRSSDYAFSLLVAMILNRPSQVFAIGFDRSRTTRNLAGNYTYNNKKAIRAVDLVFPKTKTNSIVNQTVGLINYIENYLTSNIDANYERYINRITNINSQMGFKLGGFADKDKLKLVLDSRTPLNAGNVFVPQENYKIFLNTSSANEIVSYSGLIIEKLSKGYKVSGYDKEDPFFEIYKPFESANDSAINVGGISDSFIEWSEDKTLVAGKIVKYNNRFFRVNENHVSTETFDPSFYSQLSELPITGGATALIRKRFSTEKTTLDYGTVLTDKQDVVDFILGYEKCLLEKGFTFDYNNRETQSIEDFILAIKEFLFWTTQNWATNSIIVLSPGANKLKFNRDFYVVDNIFDNFYDLEVLKADSAKLKGSFTNIQRDNTNQFGILPQASAEGIYFVKLPLVQKEHVVLIDNTTVFNDTIYDPEPGYRQERIKIVGYRTDNWNGSLNIPGFTYDEALVTEWESWKDYFIGELVKYKQFYYTATVTHSGTEEFNFNNWNQLSKRPESTLLPNWDYRANQFTDFYDLDTDNFDSEQQRLAQHLIGYQKRQYLENIINDDVAQYKFYQGMIQDKGTKNSLTKLFDKLGDADKDSLEFYEEWAIRVGQYGATDSFDEVEYQLDEKKFRIEPQTVELVNTVDQTRTDLVYQYPKADVYLKTSDYNHAPFPTSASLDEYTKTGGYVALDQVNFLARSLTDILSFDINTVDLDTYIWVPEVQQSWNVYKHIQSPARINKIEKSDLGFTATFDRAVPFTTGEIIGINNINEDLNGFWSARSVSLNVVEFYTNKDIGDDAIDLSDSTQGIVSQLNGRRLDNISDVNSLLIDYDINENEKLWLDDNGNTQSEVIENSPVFSLQAEIPNEEGLNDSGFGTAFSASGSNQVLAVGMPDVGLNGKVAVYTRLSEALEYVLLQTLEPNAIKTVAIETITNANPGRIFTPVVHNLEAGQRILISSAEGLTALNDNYYYVNPITTTSFDLYTDKALTSPVDTTAMGTHTIDTGLLATGILYDTGAGFGTAVEVTDNGQYILVGAPYASDVRSKYAGEFDATSSYLQGDIVSDRGTLWEALRDTPAGIADSTISTLSQDWQLVDSLQADQSGTISNYTNQGVLHVYKKDVTTYKLETTILSPVARSNEQFGIAIKSAFTTDLVHKFYVRSIADQGRIYFIENSLANVNSFRYSRDTNYKGTFDPLKTYYPNEIVFAGYILYKANTTVFASSGIEPGSADEWEVLDQYIDYVGFVPNLGDVTALESDSVGLGGAVEIGKSFDVSKDGNVIAITGFFSATEINRVSVYRFNNNTGRYVYESNIDGDVKLEENFASAIAVSDNGQDIAVGATLNDVTGLNNGKVYIYRYNFDSNNPEFLWQQELFSPKGESNEQFGYSLDFSKNKLAVMSINGDNISEVIFDSDATTLDNSATKIKDRVKDNGQVYIFENYNDTWIYAEKMRYLRDTTSAVMPSLRLIDNHIIVGQPVSLFTNSAGVGTNVGFIIDFRSDRNTNAWTQNSLVQNFVDLTQIKNVFLYDKTNGDLVTYLDYIDPVQGKIAGPAEQELNYKLYYDPAVYNIGSTNTGNKTPWDSNYVGKLWWDLSTIKWFNTRQRGLEYKTNNWNTPLPSFEVDVYEWVESDLLPTEWDSTADTVEGLAAGVSGSSKYGDDSYVIADIYDPVTGTFSNKYYFWVKNKRTIPTIDNRTISAFDVKLLIQDPAGQGYRFVAFYENNKFGLHNIRNLIKDEDIILHVEWKKFETQNNIHSEYQLLTEGIPTSKPNADVVKKWVDSLVGYDQNSNQLPDINISVPRRYGILNTPNQSMFVNKTEALKQIVDRINGILENNLIVDDFDLSGLQKIDPQPSVYSNDYDIKIASENLLRFVAVAKVATAELSLDIQDGRIKSVIITNPGRGYVDPSYTTGSVRKGPTVDIRGTGSGAKIQLYINNIGQVTSAVVENEGKNYSVDTVAIVRRFTVLVENDSNIGGFWSLYNYTPAQKEWSVERIQSYDTTLYWQYIDWYANGYNETTAIKHLVPGSYALDATPDLVGDVVKIENIGSGGWLLLEKIDNIPEVDYTVNYKVIGRQNGTIKFSKLLYQNEQSGFDNQVFDAYLYDREPVNEVRNIMEALQNQILVDQLEVEWNKLFFASVRYALSEQVNIDWIFKTSFVKAKHNVGELQQKITFKNDNLSNYQDYVNEVKPYKTNVREYVSSYSKIEPSQSSVTDFDLQPRYDVNEGRIVAEKTSVFNNEVQTYSPFVDTYPQKHWKDNVGFEITDIKIVDGGSGWTDGPNVIISGGGGPTLKGTASLAGNTVNAVDVDTRGAIYISAPTVTFDGTQDEPSTPAKAVAIIGNSKAKSTHMLMKFDRVSGTLVFTSLHVPNETFTGTGAQEEFTLKWPIDTRKAKIVVTVNGVEALSSEYTPGNKEDTSVGYTRNLGTITFTEAPALNAAIVVDYYRNASMLNAADRISYFYKPDAGMPGLGTNEDGSVDLAQVMDGVDYGGVQIDTISFGNTLGFDTDVFGASSFDTFDSKFDDEIFVLDGSTNVLDLALPLEANVEYNVYFKSVSAGASDNPIRLDSSSWPTANEDIPFAVMQPITGDGITTSIVISDILEKYNVLTDIPYVANRTGDTIIFRKSTSDGTTTPDFTSFDVELAGGDFTGSTATGIQSGDITVDGDGFVTPTTSKGPEEQVPGQIVDALDIQVFNRVQDGQGVITVHNYLTDDSRLEYGLSGVAASQTNVIAKLGDRIIDQSEYTIDWKTNTFIFADSTAIEANKNLNIILIDNSGTDIIDSDRIVATEVTTRLSVNIKFDSNYSMFVTRNGNLEPAEPIDINGTLNIGLGTVTNIGDIIDYTIYNNINPNFSQIVIDESFQGDGVKYHHEFKTQANPDGAVLLPYTKLPLANNIIVQVNNKILNPGYRKKIVLTADRSYDIDKWQFEILSQVYQRDILVYLNGEYLVPNYWNYDPVNGRIDLTSNQIGKVGDTLEVFIIRDAEYTFTDTTIEFTSSSPAWSNNIPVGDEIVFALTDDSTVVRGVVKEKTVSSGNVTLKLYGYLREMAELFTKDSTPQSVTAIGTYGDDSTYETVTLTAWSYSQGDTLNFSYAPLPKHDVKIYTFSNHDINGFERESFDVVFSTTHAPEGTTAYIDRNNLTKGYLELSKPAISTNYVWVIKNGKLLTPEIDYVLNTDKTAVQLARRVNKNSTIEVLHFAGSLSSPKYGFRIFKDMLNRFHFKRLNNQNTYKLQQPLNYYDNKILLESTDGITQPDRSRNQPGIIWIDKERIEYYSVDGATLGGLRRGTLGTGIATVHAAGTIVAGQGPEETVPYKETQQIVDLSDFADGSTGEILLTDDLYAAANSYINNFSSTLSSYEIEVFIDDIAASMVDIFVGGRRLRKPLPLEPNNKLKDRNFYKFNATIDLDSSAGDEVVAPEYTMENVFINGESKTLLTLNIQDATHPDNIPLTGEKIIMVKKNGNLWNDIVSDTTTLTLSDSQNKIARFIRDKTISLPR